MKKKLLPAIIIAVLVANIVFTAVAAMAVEPSETKDLHAACGTANARRRSLHGASQPFGNPHWQVWVDDDYNGTEYLQNFTKVLEGEHTRIWIGLNDSIRLTNGTVVSDYQDEYGNFHFFYPWTDIGTSWLWPGYHDVISMENLTYMLQQFDEVIYPTNTQYFGMPTERPPSNTKIDMLIFNIRDELFWSPETAPFYIAGYFSPQASSSNQRNIIHIDTYEWLWRLGPNPPADGPVYIPHQYEGTVAHEFEHLIHSDMDPDEFLWVDEGCADFSGYLCGYGFPTGHIEEFLLYFWDESLTLWESYLSDYGASFMFMFYMNEHYGGADTISAIVAEQANGIEGVNNVLAALDATNDFDQIFQDWTIANYLDDTTFANGIYGYYDLDIPSDDTNYMSIPLAMSLWNQWYGDDFFGWYEKKYPTFGYPYPYGVTKPYSANYIRFLGGQPILRIRFDGEEIAGVPPYSGDYEWHSGMGNWLWNRLNQTFDIPEGGATLKFWTYYAIEENWDYGYVEVHDLTDETWTTLLGNRTITTLPYPQDNPNVPDGFEPMDYETAGEWNALTGHSEGWYQEEMDLTPFADHTIELYFTYWTDGAMMESAWLIDDIEIAEIPFFDDVELGEDGWTADPVTGWKRTTGLVDNDFTVNFAEIVAFKNFNFVQIRQMQIDDTTQEGTMVLLPFGQGPTIMIVANQPGFESPYSTGYIYEAAKFPRTPWFRGL